MVDIQERLAPALHHADAAIQRSRVLLQGLQALDVPIVITEQYPKGLGHTVAAIKLFLGDAVPLFEKTRFSALTHEVAAKIKRLGCAKCDFGGRRSACVHAANGAGFAR